MAVKHHEEQRQPPRSQKVIPLDNSYEVDQVCLCVGYLAFCISLLWVSRLTFALSVVFQATTEMYSTPNGAQGSTEEGEGSGGESGDDQVEWLSLSARA